VTRRDSGSAWKVDRVVDQCHRAPDIDQGDNAAPSSSHGLSVTARGRGRGFRASIRGKILDLAEPKSGDAFSPTPDDLFVLAIAAGFAWSARTILRAAALPDDLSVSATWRTLEHPRRLTDLTLRIFVSRRAAAGSAALAAALDESFAARSLADAVIHISVEGVS
jgi:uncharacterized OsmC-like protein